MKILALLVVSHVVAAVIGALAYRKNQARLERLRAQGQLLADELKKLSTLTTPTMKTLIGGLISRLSSIRWKNVVSAAALGVAVWMQVKNPEHFSAANLAIWLGVAISGHIVSKIPSPGSTMSEKTTGTENQGGQP